MKAGPTPDHMWHITHQRQDNLWLIYSSFTNQQRDLSHSDTYWQDGEVTDTLHWITKLINDAKTIINYAKTIINRVHQKYQELFTKHLVEIIEKSMNQIIL